ncbi:hypothetical protein OPQ81_010993 [Rhizoctonia solani]|nr:hypothetical protein OPQ81_010993 [Rhizoctonia solani]
MPTVESLEPHIQAILTAPAVDLNTVSAKRVRAQLKVNVPELEDEWVRENKAEIDGLIAAVFDRVRAGEEQPSPTTTEKSGTPPAPTNKRKRTAEEDADAEYARRLASELNGHNTRAGSVGKKKETKSRRKVTKSAEEIEDTDDEEPAKKKSKPKKATKQDHGDGESKKRGGYQKEYALSPELAAFTGVAALSRPQIVKRLWEHIKAHNLQNPQDKREILCDEQMKGLFGVDKINMFQMNKVIGHHIINDPA